MVNLTAGCGNETSHTQVKYWLRQWTSEHPQLHCVVLWKPVKHQLTFMKWYQRRIGFTLPHTDQNQSETGIASPWQTTSWTIFSLWVFSRWFLSTKVSGFFFFWELETCLNFMNKHGKITSAAQRCVYDTVTVDWLATDSRCCNRLTNSDGTTESFGSPPPTWQQLIWYTWILWSQTSRRCLCCCFLLRQTECIVSYWSVFCRSSLSGQVSVKLLFNSQLRLEKTESRNIMIQVKFGYYHLQSNLRYNILHIFLGGRGDSERTRTNTLRNNGGSRVFQMKGHLLNEGGTFGHISQFTAKKTHKNWKIWSIWIHQCENFTIICSNTLKTKSIVSLDKWQYSLNHERIGSRSLTLAYYQM